MIPGEPEDARQLGKMIDAPIGERRGWSPEWPDTALEMIPIGVAKTVRPGNDVTVVTYGRLVGVGKKVAEELAAEGIDVELVDLRSLHPYDWGHVADSIKKTGRVVFANEDTEVTNFGEHLVRRAVEELWDVLKAPPVLEAGKHLPGVGLAEALENASVPGAESLAASIRRAMQGGARDTRRPDRVARQKMMFTAEPADARAAFDEMARAHRHR
jgi:2-oxoisovalerate dehydrogenase E1 component beta subunit